MNLKGQTAIISGGLGDIGRAIALELAKNGANISIGDVKSSSLAKPFLENIRDYGSKAIYSQVDILNHQAVKEWFDITENKIGIPSIIISNAGIVTRKSILEITAEEWNNEFAVNVHGVLSFCQTAAHKLIDNKLSGKIVLIGSWAAHRPNKNIPAYCASKSALRMLGKSMALEFSKHDIVVNEVAPGIVNAGLSSENIKTMKLEDIQSKIPVGGWIEPEEVAWQAANLCDPRNKNTLGSVVVMDGGLSMTNMWG